MLRAAEAGEVRADEGDDFLVAEAVAGRSSRGELGGKRGEGGRDELEAIGREDDESIRLRWRVGGARDGEEGGEGLSGVGDPLVEVDRRDFGSRLDVRRREVVSGSPADGSRLDESLGVRSREWMRREEK